MKAAEVGVACSG